MQAPTEDDLELTTLLTSGDEAAFQAIYTKHSRVLYRYARKTITTVEDCEEIVQDVFVSLWERREQLGDIQVLKAYLIQMVKYKVIRYLQHEKVKLKYNEHYRLFETIYDNSAEDQRDAELINRRLEEMLNDLPDRCRDAMRLRVYESLSNGEIAERMNITKKTVEVYMYKAFEHLRANQDRLIKG